MLWMLLLIKVIITLQHSMGENMLHLGNRRVPTCPTKMTHEIIEQLKNKEIKNGKNYC